MSEQWRSYLKRKLTESGKPGYRPDRYFVVGYICGVISGVIATGLAFVIFR